MCGWAHTQACSVRSVNTRYARPPFTWTAMRYLDTHSRNFDQSGEHDVVIDPLGRFVALSRALGRGAIETHVQPQITRLRKELEAIADSSASAEDAAKEIAVLLRALHRSLVEETTGRTPLVGLELVGVLLKDASALHFGAGSADLRHCSGQTTRRLHRGPPARRTSLGVRPPMGGVKTESNLLPVAVGDRFALLSSNFDPPDDATMTEFLAGFSLATAADELLARHKDTHRPHAPSPPAIAIVEVCEDVTAPPTF